MKLAKRSGCDATALQKKPSHPYRVKYSIKINF
jgi:hypothetical protein